MSCERHLEDVCGGWGGKRRRIGKQLPYPERNQRKDPQIQSQLTRVLHPLRPQTPVPSPTHTAGKHSTYFKFYLKSEHSIIYFVLQPNK